MVKYSSIQNTVRRQSRLILDSSHIDGRGIDAYTLAIDLKMDRANVSRVLNTLWREGLFIKFQGKPTLFLDRELVSEYYPGFFIPQTVAKGEVLSDLIRPVDEAEAEGAASTLDQLIGADTSLKDAIALAKASVSYPPFGLHTLLYGAVGAGKSRFAHCMYLYKKNTAPPGGTIPFVSVACHNFSDNPKLFSQQLLGLARDMISNKAKRGFLDSAKGGILFFDDVENLPAAALDLIASVITRHSYNRIGDTAPRQIQCMIIASTTRRADDSYIRVLAESLPAAIHIPDLEERGVYEKTELILQLFSAEARTIRQSVRISKDVITCLAAMRYDKNILQLTNEVKAACSRAYLESLSNQHKAVYVQLYHLSPELLTYTKDSFGREEIRQILVEVPDRYIEVDHKGDSKFLESFASLPSIAAAGKQKLLEGRLNTDITSIDNIYQTVVASITDLSHVSGTELHALKRSIYPIVFQVVTAQLLKYGKYDESRRHIHLLYGLLMHVTNFLKRPDSPLPDRDEAPPASRECFPDEYRMAADIMEHLSRIYSRRFSNREIDYLASYFAIFSNWTTTLNPGFLVICHGEGTASGMVNYARQAVRGDYLMDFIDFTEEMKLRDCLELSAEKARQLNRGFGVLIFTDMEPLTTMNESITKLTGIHTEMISPVTLPLLLDTVRRILESPSELTAQAHTALPQGQSKHTGQKPAGTQDGFICDLLEKVISRTTVFLDTSKAAAVLEKCLKATLFDLHLPYSNEIAARYLCHCCNMLERAIRGEPWTYSRLNGFTNEHYELMCTVEHKLEYAENIFGIKIPAGEIAYIAEIFLS